MRRIGATLLDNQGTVLTGLSPYFLNECTWGQGGTTATPQAINGGTSYDIVNISGAGILYGFSVYLGISGGTVNPNQMVVTIDRDGVEILHKTIQALYFANGAQTNTFPAGVWATKYDTTNKLYAVALVGMHIPFTSSIVVTVTNAASSGNNLQAWYGYVVVHT